MDSPSNGIERTADDIAENARDLIAATANAADEKVVKARNRLVAVMESARDSVVAAQKKTIETAQAADKAIRANPYPAIGIAFGVGALVGFLLSNRRND